MIPANNFPSGFFSNLATPKSAFSQVTPTGHQILIPQAIRPIPQIGRGIIGCPITPLGKLLDFSNYANKYAQRVNQYPIDNVPNVPQNGFTTQNINDFLSTMMQQ